MHIHKSKSKFRYMDMYSLTREWSSIVEKHGELKFPVDLLPERGCAPCQDSLADPSLRLEEGSGLDSSAWVKVEGAQNTTSTSGCYKPWFLESLLSWAIEPNCRILVFTLRWNPSCHVP